MVARWRAWWATRPALRLMLQVMLVTALIAWTVPELVRQVTYRYFRHCSRTWPTPEATRLVEAFCLVFFLLVARSTRDLMRPILYGMILALGLWVALKRFLTL